MAPSIVTIDSTPDLDFGFSAPTMAPTPTPTSGRTLLLAPPSIASHESALRAVLSRHDRATTDLQMLDRVAAGLVALPAESYGLVLVLGDADADAGSSRAEAADLLGRRAVLEKVVAAMRPGATLRSDDGGGNAVRLSDAEQREAVLAGLVKGEGEGSSYTKPEYKDDAVVMLRFGKGKKNGGGAVAKPVVVAAPTPVVTMTTATTPAKRPAGVGFVDFSDDFDAMDEDGDDDLIDEDSLLTEEDKQRPLEIRMSPFPVLLLSCGALPGALESC